MNFCKSLQIKYEKTRKEFYPTFQIEKRIGSLAKTRPKRAEEANSSYSPHLVPSSAVKLNLGV